MRKLLTRTVAIATAGLLLVASPGVGAQKLSGQNTTLATAQQLEALHAQAAWIDDLTVQLERRGQTVSDRDAREIRLINNELARIGRLPKGSGGSTRVPTSEAEALADRLARMWLNLRGAPSTVVTKPTSPTASAPNGTTIPYGTVVMLSLDRGLNSGTANVRDRFTATLVDPIYNDGVVAIPGGAVFEGSVAEVDRAGRISDGGRLNLVVDGLRGSAGESAQVSGIVIGTATEDELRGKSSDTKTTVGGALAGAIAGAILGGGFKGVLIGIGVGAGGALIAQKGQDVDLPEGSVLKVEFQTPVTVTWTWSTEN